MKNQKSEVAHRMKAICEARFEGKPTRFAAALKISYPNLSQYFLGKSLPGNKMQSRLRDLGIDPEWVIYGTGHSPVSPMTDPGKASTTKLVEGEHTFAVYHKVPRTAYDFVHLSHLELLWSGEDFSPKGYVFLELSKEIVESMKPVLAAGDLVLIARKSHCNDGDLVAARWDDGPGAIKIFHDVDGKVGLWSINPSIEPLVLPKKVVSIYKVVLIRKKSA
jgi:hypothetical protein